MRPVRFADKIVKEAVRMGYERIIMPASNLKTLKGSFEGCDIVGVRNVTEALRIF